MQKLVNIDEIRPGSIIWFGIDAEMPVTVVSIIDGSYSIGFGKKVACKYVTMLTMGGTWPTGRGDSHIIEQQFNFGTSIWADID